MSRRGIEIPCQNKCGRLSSPPYRGGYFCDECAHAPKTDTPATPLPEDLIRDWRYHVAGHTLDQYAWWLLTQVAAARQERENLESTLAAERASRLQADTEQFNAGIQKAVDTCQLWIDSPSCCLRGGPCDHIRTAGGIKDRLLKEFAKPSVSPEQAEEKQ